MSHRTRICVALAAIVVLAVPTVTLTLADPPELKFEDIPAIPETILSEDPPPNDPETERIIGESIQRGDYRKTGDPEADQVLDLINQRKSVLEGSSLDPELTFDDLPETEPTPDSSHAMMAERLLRTARLLEKIEPADKTRRDLVNQMRRESVRLLRVYE